MPVQTTVPPVQTLPSPQCSQALQLTAVEAAHHAANIILTDSIAFGFIVAALVFLVGIIVYVVGRLRGTSSQGVQMIVAGLVGEILISVGYIVFENLTQTFGACN
jgi:hypothetical protein